MFRFSSVLIHGGGITYFTSNSNDITVMNKEFGGGMKLEGGVARGSNAAAVKTDNLFTGGL